MSPASTRSDGARRERHREIQHLGVETAVVIGGNIFRGVAGSKGMDQPRRLHGMLATVINPGAAGCARNSGVCDAGHDRYRDAGGGRASSGAARCAIWKKAASWCSRRHRHPYFTTDTAAALGHGDAGDVILKAMKVDGIYTADPLTDLATRFDRISYLRSSTRGSSHGYHSHHPAWTQSPSDHRLQPEDAGNLKRRDGRAYRLARPAG